MSASPNCSNGNSAEAAASRLLRRVKPIIERVDIGKRLLMSVGCDSPDDVSIRAAIEAKDEFIGRLEAIRDRARRTIYS